MKLIHTVEFNDGDDYLDVEFEGYPRIENDSFDYAGTHCTGGVGGTHQLPDYASMADSQIKWDKAIYTDEQNKIIKDWLTVDKNTEELEEAFCELLMKEVQDYFDDY